MRVTYRLMLAVALLLPIGIADVASAGSVAGTICKTETGTMTIAPGLGVTATAQTVVVTTAIKACTGSGVTTGTGRTTFKTAASTCAIVGNSGLKSTMSGQITWNTKQISTITGTATITPMAQLSITSTVTGGPLKGAHGTTLLALQLPAGSGRVCIATAPLKVFTVVSALKPLVIK